MPRPNRVLFILRLRRHRHSSSAIAVSGCDASPGQLILTGRNTIIILMFLVVARCTASIRHEPAWRSVLANRGSSRPVYGCTISVGLYLNNLVRLSWSNYYCQKSQGGHVSLGGEVSPSCSKKLPRQDIPWLETGDGRKQRRQLSAGSAPKCF